MASSVLGDDEPERRALVGLDALLDHRPARYADDHEPYGWHELHDLAADNRLERGRRADGLSDSACKQRERFARLDKVYYDSGAVQSAASNASIPFTAASRTEHMQVRVMVNGLWSAYADVSVVNAIVPPPAPTVAAVGQPGVVPSILVTIRRTPVAALRSITEPLGRRPTTNEIPDARAARQCSLHRLLCSKWCCLHLPRSRRRSQWSSCTRE